MEIGSKIAVLGASGLVGSALVRELESQRCQRILAPSRSEVDLLDPVVVRWWFSCHEPDYVFLCAARVGGIRANIADPVGFLVDNLNIETNVIRESVRYEAKKLVFLGSSCVYPENCDNPITEDALLTGPFTPEVEAYGLAKVCGIKLCQYVRKQFGRNFVSVMPCNLFGERDNFDIVNSHCLPGLIARMDLAKVNETPEFQVWGSGNQTRELMYSADLAKILVGVMQCYDSAEPLNVGSGFEITIRDLAEKVARVVGYPGRISFDPSQPEGKKRKVLDNSRARALLPWEYEHLTPFDTALDRTYLDYLKNLC